MDSFHKGPVMGISLISHDIIIHDTQSRTLNSILYNLFIFGKQVFQIMPLLRFHIQISVSMTLHEHSAGKQILVTHFGMARSISRFRNSTQQN